MPPRLFTILFLLTAFSTFSFAQKEKSQFVFIKAGRMIDVNAGKVLENQGILIEGNYIKEVGPIAAIAAKTPKNATTIDLSDATVLPGLIDCHTHITMEMGNYYEDLFRKSPINIAVEAHIFAKKTLDAGFTTVRDLGAAEFVDIALRDAINKGTIPGPRIQAATLDVGASGGHNDISGFSPYLKFGTFSGIADGVDEIRKLIRFEIKNGADVIKMVATAGVLSEEESVGAPQYSQEEMNAVVEEAAMWGRKVAAHAHGAEGIKRAVRAGVASIDHGSLLDDEGIRMMKERGTYLVPNIYVGEVIINEGKAWGLPEKMLEKMKSMVATRDGAYRKAFTMGVKVAYGTDAGVFPHGENGKDFKHLVRLGMSPMQAIRTATVHAADLMGWSDRIGSIEPGKYADIIAVKADPLKDISVLERVDVVVKGGRRVR